MDLEDEAGIKNSQSVLSKLIDEEIRTGIDASRIIMAGISMGGAQAIYTTLTIPQSLGGLVALSTFIPLRTELIAAAPLPNRNVPCLQVHGDADTIIPLNTIGTLTSQILGQLLTDFEFKVYTGLEHRISDEELLYVKAFINEHLPANK